MEPKTKNNDSISIPGDYQKKALESGHRFQKAWHSSRLSLLDASFSFTLNDVVADIGCGSGIFVDRIFSKVKHVYAVDSNNSAVTYCRQRFSGEKNIEVIHGTLDKTGIPSKSLTHIVCTEVLEHVYDQQIPGILQHWATLLKDGGRVLITTPNDRSLWPIIEWGLDHTKIVPKMEDDQHVSHWTQSKLKSSLMDAGFSNINTGTFNLFSPIVHSLGGYGLSQLMTKIEQKTLFFGGPLIWAMAEIKAASKN